MTLNRNESNDSVGQTSFNVDQEPDVAASRRQFLKTAAVGATVAAAAGPLMPFGANAQPSGEQGSDGILSRLQGSETDRNRRILLKGGIVLSMDRSVGDFMNADVLIEGKTIRAVGPNLSAPDAIVVDATNTIVMPGFVNTHHHQFQTNTRGYFADAFYFTSGRRPDYRRAFMPGGIHEKYTPEDAYIGQLVGGLTNISAGVTTVCDTSQVSITRKHTDACIDAFKESGHRTVFVFTSGPGNAASMADYAFPQDIHRIKSQYFSSEDQLMTLGLGAFPPDVKAVFPLAREIKMPIYVHVTGAARSAVVEELGILADCTIIHAMDLPESAWRQIVDNGAKVSMSSVTEPTVANGIPAIMEVMKYGIMERASFSTDAEAFMTADFFSQMRGAFMLQRLLAVQLSDNGQRDVPRPITCREVLEMSTMGGAVGANLAHKVGSLTPGKEADVIMLRVDMINVWPITNVPGAIVTLMDTSNVDTVFIAGKVRKWRGRLVNVDMVKLLRSLETSRDQLFARAGWRVEPFGTCCER
ncbi:amidohydrolase [Bradyrhizobium sp. CCBAU 53340]|uniref:amidohydrolase family protein n=1 Tax=Bradyrhizobium sp. CCBAU 53340 TaxID=1325112 RepID=UPI00188B9628|nr:amidohydrolase family protein [Bradyrhizobium sp. CCBAU 53340]QOZ44715.1 amidohydrolase [Bradyrhizobium sp. CCBAU 53340]